MGKMGVQRVDSALDGGKVLKLKDEYSSLPLVVKVG